jgi:FAD synthase
LEWWIIDPTVDVHKSVHRNSFFDFNADLYNQEIRVSILKEFVPKKKFESLIYWKNNLKKTKNCTLYLNKFWF